MSLPITPNRRLLLRCCAIIDDKQMLLPCPAFQIHGQLETLIQVSPSRIASFNPDSGRCHSTFKL